MILFLFGKKMAEIKENNEEFDFSDLYEGECGYFENKKNHEEVYILSPVDDFNNFAGNADEAFFLSFDFFLGEGFRRSGNYIYRATCPDCKRCIPIRIQTEKFQFNKNQRHLLKKNSDIQIEITDSFEKMITTEKIALMKQYNLRHEPNKIETDEEVHEMLIHMNGLTDMDDNVLEKPFYPGIINMDYYLNGKLVGVGIIDFGYSTFSSNYFYYDISNEIMKRSIGTFTILKEIEFCKENNIPLYYLGYYLSECRKMNYKGRFLPHELRIGDKWIEQSEQNFDV